LLLHKHCPPSFTSPGQANLQHLAMRKDACAILFHGTHAYFSALRKIPL